MKDWGSDSHCWSLWTLDQLVEENSNRVDDFVAFGDFLICSHLYYFKFENDEISSVWYDCEHAEPDKIAESVEDFFRIYLENPEKLGMFG
jgi:hypothetical protein